MRVLVTGFGPFPGAPANPSAALARRVAADSRWRLAGVIITAAEIPTTWKAQDRWPKLIRQHQPGAIVLFGLAGRRRHVSVETRAINRRNTLRPDADGRLPATSADVGEPFARPSRAPCAQLVAGLARAAVPARVSIHAGDYLCNAALWSVLSATEAARIPVVFIHIPRPARPLRRKATRPRPTMAKLHRAAVIVVRGMLRAAVSNRHRTEWPGS